MEEGFRRDANSFIRCCREAAYYRDQFWLLLQVKGVYILIDFRTVIIFVD